MTAMVDLFALVRENGLGNHGRSYNVWGALGLGIAVITIIFVVVKLIACHRRRARRETRASFIPNPSTNTQQTSGQGPFRAPDPTQRPLSVPPRAVYMGGRYILFPADSQPPQWAQQPYPPHGVGLQTNTAATARAEPVPRFNPDDFVSFDVTGEDKTNPCPICLGLLEEEPVSTGQCLHLMHTSCLKSWLAKDVNSACPVCRVSYVDNAANDLDAAMSIANGETVNMAQSSNTNATHAATMRPVSLR